jgi:hypothetical protein
MRSSIAHEWVWMPLRHPHKPESMAAVRAPDAAENLESSSTDVETAVRAAKLWPNREHESNGVTGLLCRAGLHRWKRLDLSELMPGKDILHCFWCSKVKVDGIVYDV